MTPNLVLLPVMEIPAISHVVVDRARAGQLEPSS